jgi:hypothetical protein
MPRGSYRIESGPFSHSRAAPVEEDILYAPVMLFSSDCYPRLGATGLARDKNFYFISLFSPLIILCSFLY